MTYTFKVDEEHLESEISETLEQSSADRVRTSTVGDLLDGAKEGLPVFVEKPKSTQVLSGQPVEIKCKVSGEPSPDVVWIKEDKAEGTSVKVTESDRVKVEYDTESKTSSLKIADSRVEDTATYTVQITNEVGTSKASVSVVVAENLEDLERAKTLAQRPPTLEQTTAKDLGEDDLAAAMSEQATIKKKKKVKTTKGKVKDEAETQEVTEVRDIQEEISETVVREAAAKEARLDQEEEEEEPLPEFIKKPEPSTVKEGEVIRLTCQIADEPQPEISWAKDGKKIKQKKKDQRVHTGYEESTRTQYLEISEATFEDAGEYTLTAENDGGIVACTVSVNVVSKIEKRPPKLEEGPKPQIVREGDTITLPCRVSGEPEPELTYYRNGEPVKASTEVDGRISISYKDNVHLLTIRDATVEDSGEYTMTAMNERGKICHAVTISVQPKGVEFQDSGVIAPEFATKLEPVTVAEGKDVKLQTTVKGTDVSVSWFKEGKPLKSVDNLTIGKEGESYYVEIRSSKKQDSGEYTCTASNMAGSAFSTVNVTVKEEAELKKEITETLTVQVQEERTDLSEEQARLLMKYTMRDNYTCKDKQVELLRGDVVEALDTEKETMWLVRKENDKNKVCYVPVGLLQGEGAESSEEEEEDETPLELFPTYTAITDYNPTEADHLALKEGDLVEVLDSKSPDKWLCRLLNKPNMQGWVPPSYLVAKSDEKLDTRSTQEMFRDDVIKMGNKKQEAVMKRRYALKDLWESERQYVRDLGFVMDTYFKAFDQSLPQELAGKRDVVFSTFPEIFDFHNSVFLDALLHCSNEADDLADTFLNNREHFQQYVPYFKNRSQGSHLLDQEESKKFIKDYDLTLGNKAERKLSLPAYLARPWDRLDEYIAVLKDFLRYTAKAAQNTTKLERAIEMLLELRKQADDQSSLDHIVGFVGELTELGPVHRHDDFLVWEGEPVGKGKERHLFLFKNKLLLTRKKKPEFSGELPTYEFRGMIDLRETLLNEELDNDRRFELCYEDVRRGKFTFQAKSVPIKQAWCDLLRRWLLKWGARASFATKLEKTTCKEGEQVKFRCKLIGQPLPEVTWYFNGQPIAAERGGASGYDVIQDGYECILMINKASLENAGRYSIKIKNSTGEDESSAVLTVDEVLEKPVFSTELSNSETTLKGDAQFACKVDGKPPPKIKWYKDGKELSSSDRIKILSPDVKTNILIITRVEEEDLGVYECNANNRVGSLSSKAKLIITDLQERKKERAPEFLSNFSDVLAVEGTEVKLDLRYAGYPAPEVTWLKDGNEVKDTEYFNIVNTEQGERSTLYIRRAHREHSGRYTCRLKNKFGTVEVTAVVEVSTTPEITTRLVDQETFIGETAKFTCKYKGDPPPGVLWFHNKLPLTDTERIRIEKKEGEATLILTKVIKTDDGEYTCRLSNAAGEVTSSARLFAQQPLEERQGPVTYAPSFTKKLLNQEGLLGSQAKFVCKAIGEPRPTVKWYKDGALLTQSDRIVMDTEENIHRLFIRELVQEDEGTYRCIVKNSEGEVSSDATLVVDVPKEEGKAKKKEKKPAKIYNLVPSINLEKPTIQEIDYYNFELIWKPATLPANAKQTDITYIVERKDLGRSNEGWISVERQLTETRYKVSGFNPEQDCLYRIRAQNEFGISDPSMSTTYTGRPINEIRSDLEKSRRGVRRDKLPPRPPRDKPTISEIKDDCLELYWPCSEFPEYAEPTDIFYVIERRCPPSTNWIEIGSDVKDTTYIMKDYRPEKDYMFRVRAGNEYGISDPSMSSTFFSKIGFEGRKTVEAEDYKSKVKPRTIWDKPDLVDQTEDTVKLKWKPSSIPQYAVQTPIWYLVEQRVPPSLEWTKLTTDCKETELEIKYSSSKDYYFRVRAANEYGVAEPSMPAMLRKKEEVYEITQESRTRKKREKKEEEHVATRRVPEHLRIIPEFLPGTDDTQYGVEGRTSVVNLRLRAYPEPKVSWFFHNKKLEMGDKFVSSLSDMGELTLTIYDFSMSEVGEYKAQIDNEFGSATRIIKFEMSDPPTFLEPLRDQVFHLHSTGKLECRVHGIPYPTVTFKKDWRVVAGSHRVKIVREEFDHWTVNIQNTIHMDEGVYECVAENLAGSVYCTANVKISEKAGYWREIKFNSVPIEEYFHVIDEIGRGSYGVVRRVIDKNSGNQYAAKFMRYNDVFVKEELMSELEMMALLDHNNIVQVVDGFEDKKRLVIVQEIVTGGELLQRLINDDSLTESEVSFYIRQLLLAVEHMHSKNVIHLDIKPENLLLLRPSSEELKLSDFGFARHYNPTHKLHVKYGNPEFCAPEVARDDPITPAADCWSIGIVAYILLSGLSPFYKENAQEMFDKVRDGSWSFDPEAFSNISNEAKDFITKLLEKDPKKRMTATEAVEHPFMELSNHRGLGNRIPLERHRAYLFRRKCEKGQNLVKTVVQPKPLSNYGGSGALHRALNPQGGEVSANVPALHLPGMDDMTEEGSDNESTFQLELEQGAAGMLLAMGPMHLVSAPPSSIGSGSESDWGREYEDEDTWYEFSSVYQTGPETHLFPAKDTGLTLRMAKYRRSVQRGSSGAPSRSSMRERRDLRDLDKELEMDEKSGVMRTRAALRTVTQLRGKIGTGEETEGYPPIFKEKIHDKAYNVGDSCTLNVHVVGNPAPLVTWYRNEELLSEGGRVRVGTRETGRHYLTILQTKPNDFGVYKCVARNKFGTVTCRARMLCGDHPSRPGRPHVTKVSDKESFMIWEEPETDGNSYIQAYKVDWFKPGDDRWTTATYCIDECALVKGLKPDTSYRFRVSAINKFGQGPYSWASVEIRTKKKGAASLDIDEETKRILLRSRQAASRPSPEPSPASSPFGSTEDLTAETKAKDGGALIDREIHLQETDPAKYVQFGNEVWRGRFALIRNAQPKEGTKVTRVAKISLFNSARPSESLREFEMLKAIRQEHVVRLYEAYRHEDFVILIFEKLYGENVVRSISLKNRYDEHIITIIIKQVLDALQFLHHRGIVHLNIQPDNVIMTSRRRFDVKLIDFGQAHKVTTTEGEKVERTGTVEFFAPEKVAKENVGVAADVWGVGVLAFILLSGQSPFYGGDNEEDTFANIKHVRYDAHSLYHNCTKFGMKFLYQTLKRSPKSRLTVEECLDHRWLMLNHQMIKARKSASFPTDRLKNFLSDYISRRMRNAILPQRLQQVYGAPAGEETAGIDFLEDEEENYFSRRRISHI